jgi:two-component SAPR family response regulator
MTKTIKWRLSKLPSVEELQSLVKDKIIIQEEARSILFNEVEDGTRDVESFESEIKFLRELVDKLSERSRIVEVIKQVQVPYIQYPWVTPYVTWCSLNNSGTFNVTGTTYAISSSATNESNSAYAIDTSGNFAGIKTF